MSATREDDINTGQLTELLLLNLGSRNACMRALIAHPSDLNAAADWLIQHSNDANFNTNPFTEMQQQQQRQQIQTQSTFSSYSQPITYTKQQMIQQVMDLGYTRDEALRAYVNVDTNDRNDKSKLVQYLKNSVKKTAASSYASTPNYQYKYRSSSNKKKVQRPVINIDDIKIEVEEICDIKDCEQLAHICIIMREWTKFLEKAVKGEHVKDDAYKNGFYAYFMAVISGEDDEDIDDEDKYLVEDVMNDFIFLCVKRDDKLNEFDAMRAQILKEIKVIDFDLYNPLVGKREYFGFDDNVNEVCFEQLCDKMYCYFVLCFDAGARLKKGLKLSECAGQKYKDCVDLLNANCKIVSNENKYFDGFDVNNLDIRIDTKALKKKKKEKDENEIKNDERIKSFGVRFNYWQSVEDLIGIFMDVKDAKYENLKAEMTQNPKVGMSDFEYNVFVKKAEIYSKTEYFEENMEAGVNLFGIDLLKKMSKEHIISLLIWCNFMPIRREFGLTLIRQSAEESNESLMERHSFFYHFGKLLRECVEAYGTEAHKLESQSHKFYHAVDYNLDIADDDKIQCLFLYTPFSTTTQMEVCMNAIEKDQSANALILELRGFVSKYFDISLLSDRCYEKEKLFFCGDRSLTVNKAINAKKGFDHKLFVKAMKIIPHIFEINDESNNFDDNESTDDATKNLVKNLLLFAQNEDEKENELNEFNIPSDTLLKMKDIFSTKTEVFMNYDAMYNHKLYAFLSMFLMTPTRTFAKMDVLSALFPKMESFTMCNAPLTTLTFMYIKNVIGQNQNKKEKNDDVKDEDNDGDNGNKYECKLKKISFVSPNTAAISIDAVVEAEKRNFAEMQWTITKSENGNDLICAYSDVPVVIKEPTPPPVVEEEKEKIEEQQPKKVLKKRRKKKKKRPKPVEKEQVENDKEKVENPASEGQE